MRTLNDLLKHCSIKGNKNQDISLKIIKNYSSVDIFLYSDAKYNDPVTKIKSGFSLFNMYSLASFSVLKLLASMPKSLAILTRLSGSSGVLYLFDVYLTNAISWKYDPISSKKLLGSLLLEKLIIA